MKIWGGGGEIKERFEMIFTGTVKIHTDLTCSSN